MKRIVGIWVLARKVVGLLLLSYDQVSATVPNIPALSREADMVVVGSITGKGQMETLSDGKVVRDVSVLIDLVLKGEVKAKETIKVRYVAYDPKHASEGVRSWEKGTYIFFIKARDTKGKFYPLVSEKFGILAASNANMKILRKVFGLKPPSPTKQAKSKPAKPARKRKYRYAIVVSNATNQDGGWSKVVKKLKKKYNGRVFRYQGGIEDVREKLSKFHPQYVCFVAKHNEASKGFVQNAIKFMCNLDSDPYEDAVWAILTGRDANDAMRIASAKPLTVEYGLLHTAGGWLQWFKEGLHFNECKGKVGGSTKKPNKKPQEFGPVNDTTEPFVKALNKNKVHFILTSGHGSQRDWQMGYPHWGGKIVIAGGGNLVGRAGNGQKYPIKTNNPKIYFGVGNCLVAHINSRDCYCCLLYTSPSPRDLSTSRMPSSA